MTWDPNYLPGLREAMVTSWSPCNMLSLITSVGTAEDHRAAVHGTWRAAELVMATTAMLGRAEQHWRESGGPDWLWSDEPPTITTGALFPDVALGTAMVDLESTSARELHAVTWHASAQTLILNYWSKPDPAVRQQAGPLEIVHGFIAKVGEPMGGRDETWQRLVGITAATIHLMGLPIARSTIHQPDAVTAKRLRKQHRPVGPVTVIDLAPVRAERDPDAEPTGRHLSQRHLVRGHWRNVRTAEGTRRVWVNGFLQGPAGTPIRKSEHVYRWRRSA